MYACRRVDNETRRRIAIIALMLKRLYHVNIIGEELQSYVNEYFNTYINMATHAKAEPRIPKLAIKANFVFMDRPYHYVWFFFFNVPFPAFAATFMNFVSVLIFFIPFCLCDITHALFL